jgi:hypothetical protein
VKFFLALTEAARISREYSTVQQPHFTQSTGHYASAIS